ncbi:hypothetical protein SLS53_002006 [Cytospora paraplurivora]|uniref:Uncharacterized protein n=1 Tax=Cytospora paraplurivora TaxID=2898453 RepID=A0AAN9UFU8_9PEZI
MSHVLWENDEGVDLPLNTAGEQLDMYDEKVGIATDEYDDDYVASHVDLGTKPDYHLLGLPVPSRLELGPPRLTRCAMAPVPIAHLGDYRWARDNVPDTLRAHGLGDTEGFETDKTATPGH